MNNEGYVPISTIAKLPKIQSLTEQKSQDPGLLLRVLKSSRNLQVDGRDKMIRFFFISFFLLFFVFLLFGVCVTYMYVYHICSPRPGLPRTTIVFRDIPATTPEKEFKKIFDDQHCGKIISIVKETGDVWFVSFEDEIR